MSIRTVYDIIKKNNQWESCVHTTIGEKQSFKVSKLGLL